MNTKLSTKKSFSKEGPKIKVKADDLRMLWKNGMMTLRELETETGILASGKEEIYGCIFGRDSLITSLKLLTVYEKTGQRYFLDIVKKILLNLLTLQGTTVNIESGEEPGKCIHEYRPDNHVHLTKHPEKPWYLYPDSIMRNYDTVDATPLLLLALARYYQLSHEEDFLTQVMPGVDAALRWMLEYGDSNDDGFIDYQFRSDRTFSGLVTQSWMDSHDSRFHEDGSIPPYPIAPVEVQAYSYAAFKAWAQFFQEKEDPRYKELSLHADLMKQRFNEAFILNADHENWSLAFALDGNGHPLTAARSSMSHVLWATWKNETTGEQESVLEAQHIPRLVKRILKADLFEPNAGIRTLSCDSTLYSPHSYHNGSIWPHDTSMAIEGLMNFGYTQEAELVRLALLRTYLHFGTPIELFVYNEEMLHEYRSQSGQGACRKQAWSAASLLSEISYQLSFDDPSSLKSL